MFIDERGCLVRDQNSDFDAARGDSCYETAAFALSHWFVEHAYHSKLRLDQFVTATGTVRHPDVKWREDDMSEDNEKPLYMFFRETQNNVQRARISISLL